MVTHHLQPDTVYNAMGERQPALRAQPGDTVVLHTLDALGFDREGAQRGEKPNPQTGPVWVEGAEPGDALEVSIVRLTPSRATGWTYGPLAVTALTPDRVRALRPRERYEWLIDSEAGAVRLADPPASLADLTLPLEPMVGCFGVAPANGEAVSTATPARHGGNMDWRGFRPGATVWFPVAVPGALFSAGDGHVRQGDGEVGGTGVETSMEMEFRLGLRKGWRIGWPRGITADGQEIYTVGNARPLDQALQHATTEMLTWLETDYGYDIDAASHLLGQAVRYDIGNVVSPAYTVVCRLALGVVSRGT
jgi:acetamidase/formamidase